MREITVQLNSQALKDAIEDFKKKLSAEGYTNITIHANKNGGHDTMLYSEMESDAMMLMTAEQTTMLLANNLGADIVEVAKVNLKHAKKIMEIGRHPERHMNLLLL